MFPRTRRYVLGEIFPTLEEDTGRGAVPVLGEWPESSARSSLDKSQLAAVQLALTRELALIQGPPGTGKTFVGLKIVQALLQNYRVRKPGPILVVRHHARFAPPRKAPPFLFSPDSPIPMRSPDVMILMI